MSDFDPRRARGKRPMPIWWDAFLRDTTIFEVDEIGAYLLILGSMWTSKNCDLPDVARNIAKAGNVSLRLWNSRISDQIMPLLKTENGRVFSERLRREATYTERTVTLQHCRKTGENADKYLKSIGSWSTADISPENPRNYPREHPTQQPNNPTYKKETSSKSCENASKNLELFGDPEPEPEKVEEAQIALGKFNDMAQRAGLPIAQRLTDKRKSAIKARLKDAGGMEGWEVALSKVENSPHCTGQNNRGWKAGIDFIVNQSNFVKIMEGNYDPRTTTDNGGGNGNDRGRRDPHLQQLAGFAAVANRGPGNR